ncbi:LysM peptidoglycan-binding domain-containing protein [uncultured Desulfobacter sp.]|uniref:LysM peptidoglycan-binding domain-containing protein n=1 Tax=uncultured Desulfobacter sp. TaxID=240139 RepID=UPI002AAB2F0A|nr:LysM peptidoglycan-binding domain-containing protein [uncultured Desulfobacter sp.]
MSFFRASIYCLVICPVILVLITPCPGFSAQGVKTSFKTYSLFTYNDRSYLCEPYLVQKDEWLYKILRQKGEISSSDFPLFLKIFKTINPQISNIDAISPGSRILIPLKPVDKNDYEHDNNGTVEVPVLEFSAQINPAAVSQHTYKHEVKAGDTLSRLLSKEFLTSGGNVSKVGEKTIFHLNPTIKNINLIYQGAKIVIPDPSILSQPWFNDFVVMGEKILGPGWTKPAGIAGEKKSPTPAFPPLSKQDLAYLKRYTRLIRGRLMHRGKLFFPPGSQGRKPEFIDLSQTPVLSNDAGNKTVLLGPDITEETMDSDLVAAMKAYWKDLEFKKISEILQDRDRLGAHSMEDVPSCQESLIETLLAATSYAYDPKAVIPVSLNNVEMSVSLGRISHAHDPDILINSGSVYGSALDILKSQGYQILDLPWDFTVEEICIRLFSQLGYQVWKNPAFNAGRKVNNLSGVYAEKGVERLFLTRTSLFKEALSFLENENVNVILLE